MTTATAGVSIRRPRGLRACVIAFLVFWIANIIWTMIVRGDDASAAVGFVFVLLGVALGYRLVRVGVTSTHDGTLIIRNNLGTRTLPRSDIEGFRVLTSGSAKLGATSIQALLRDGTAYRIDVTTSLRCLDKRNPQRLDDLSRWLAVPA